MPTTETQALNLKNSGGIFQVLAWKNSLKWNCNSPFLQYFTWYLSLDVLGAFLVWAIVLSHGLSPAISKVTEKHRDTAPLTLQIKLLCVTTQKKAIGPYFHVVLFIMLYKVVQTFTSADETLPCDNLNEGCGRILSCSTALFPMWRTMETVNFILILNFATFVSGQLMTKLNS